MRRSIFLIVLLLVLAAPAAAGAATVGMTAVPVDCRGHCSDFYSRLAFVGAPGEANRVTVTLEDGGYLVTDAGAPLAAGDGCTPVDANTARCAGLANSIGVTGGTVETRDGADSIALAGFSGPGFSSLTIDGGKGDDVLRGGAAGDLLIAGPGRDDLHGGGGDDALRDHDGADPAPDVLAGGPGEDIVSYRGRRDAVTVDLRGGPGPDGDALSGFENVRGGSGDDRLVAGGHGAWLNGGPGDDTVIGGDGADALEGGVGRDRLEGRGGHDLLLPRDGAPDVVDCGDGGDVVEGPEENEFNYATEHYGPDPGDLLGADCERVTTDEDSAPVRVQPRSVTAGAIVLRAPRCRCRGRVILRAGGRRIGRARWARGSRTVTVALARPLRAGGERIRIDWFYGRDFPLFGGYAEYSLLVRP